jgi:hypothetical protein
MARTASCFLLSVLTILFVPYGVFAWNKAGHMLTGAIAYQVLKEDKDDATIARVVALLKQHPEFGRWDKAMQKIAREDRDLYLFMQAGRWADDARDNPTFYPPDAHYDKHHYINLPYKPKGEPDSVKTREPDELNIFRGYADRLDILKSKKDNDIRAVALCWVFHLIGDVHQPLHTVSLFTTRFKNGDRGGTLFYIRAKEGKTPISLHKYWDDLLGSSQNFTDVKNQAIELRLRKEHSRDQLTELKSTTFQDWAAKEGLELAKTAVYRNGTLEGSTQQGQAKTLPEDYAKKVQPIAERRAVLAGYRLATVLRESMK